MTTGFVGRSRELALLGKRLDRVADARSGVALAIRGRRQVGKSRLVQEFCDRSGAPYFYFTATKGASPVEAVATFTRELRECALPPEPALVPDLATGSWPDALRVLAACVRRNAHPGELLVRCVNGLGRPGCAATTLMTADRALVRTAACLDA